MSTKTGMSTKAGKGTKAGMNTKTGMSTKAGISTKAGKGTKTGMSTKTGMIIKAGKINIIRNLTKINVVKCLGISPPKYIVIHSTGNTASAQNENLNIVNNNRHGIGAHYSVDEKDIYQAVLDDHKIYHCGTANVYTQKHLECRNSNSIGIEMCQKDMKGNVAEGTIKNTALLVQYLMKIHNINESHVLRHFDVVSKTCPIAYAGTAEKNKRWGVLKKKLVGKSK